MNGPLKFIARVVFLITALTTGIAAQESVDNDPANKFYRLTLAAPAAFNEGDYDKAQALAIALLSEAEVWRDKKNWNYGNAIHAANLVLGRIALRRGKVEDAKKFLLAAGRTPGSPQRNTFGPDMLFAKEMLEKGETETVLAYFDLCAKFWLKKFAKVEEWKADV